MRARAAIVALAGRKGAVTVATNMAGRGTDIILGGNPEFLADQVLQGKGLDPVDHAEEYEAAWPETLKQIEQQVADEHDEVVELGGLYVIGSERHESRRIDNQLRGRSGRQGDPGESRFYLSLGDDLMRLFKSDIIDWGAADPEGARRRADREQAGQQVGAAGAGAGRGDELRDAQERPEVRRRDEPPSATPSTPTGAACSREPTSRSSCAAR